MKKTFSLILLVFSFISIWGQERYFSNASSGLIVREEASAKATRIGKLTYGTLVNIEEKTNMKYEVIEDGDTIQSEWVKIKYENFPFLDINDKSYEWNKTGFVVKHYLQKLEKASIKLNQIDSTTFYQRSKKPIKYSLVKVSSFEKVKKMLSDRVKWGNSSLLEEGMAIDKIILPNGQTLEIDEKEIDILFVSYYPTEEILLFEGGHSSDYSISIKTGETLETVGNPEYIIASPKNTHRLNGFFSGHECVTYFFQKKMNGSFTYLARLDLNYDICTIKEFSWINETTFMFSTMNYANISSNGLYAYFLGELKTR